MERKEAMLVGWLPTANLGSWGTLSPWARSQGSPCPCPLGLSTLLLELFLLICCLSTLLLPWLWVQGRSPFLGAVDPNLPSHVLFSPRFGDDIPGMEGLGTGKHCRVMTSCPALTQVQPCFSRGEDYLGWFLSLLGLSAALRVTREGQDSLCKLPQSCLCLHTLQDRKAI